MASSTDVASESLTLQQVVTVINQSVVVALNIKLIERTRRIRAELKDLSRDYGQWTYGTLRDGDFTCGVRLPSALAQRLTPGQVGWWTGTFEAVARREDARGRMSQYDAWRFVASDFEAEGVSEHRTRLHQAEQELTQEGILPHVARAWRDDPLPWRIGLIGQPDTKGWEDVEAKLAGATQIDLHRIPVKISQVNSIVEGIHRANQESLHALLLVRGGGDLETFDQPAIVRALATSQVYTIAGIGHATDNVLVNAAVDRAATTPTDAALYVLGQLEARQKRETTEDLRQQNRMLQQQLAELTTRRQRNPWMIITLVVAIAAVVAVVVLVGSGR
ncbi:exodeoxyribonuclease VII large subunit [Sulfobacillus harzensis]|uniref:Exonuclease VII large subunit C-terminal domain-containing protein n=1 Tax=Sulfobacillus harzensis TaxID=2729629 RepID=A0A7Y0L3Z1_9FIRM|nr:exodeoxyribonuclease VII large subunit [Sulfobacillus harzensis]NMP22648.1 hypothetical protein [Sulfobacillus harzensis]